MTRRYALTEAPKGRARKGAALGRKVVVLGLGGGLALVGSEKLRSKVLDTLFGKEEEFQYTPPPAPTPAPPRRRSAPRSRARAVRRGARGRLRWAPLRASGSTHLESPRHVEAADSPARGLLRHAAN